MTFINSLKYLITAATSPNFPNLTTQRRDYRLKNWALISGNWVLVSYQVGAREPPLQVQWPANNSPPSIAKFKNLKSWS